MPSTTYQLFVTAMRERSQLVCTYDGFARELCPIVLGHTDGREKALVFQFAGAGSKGPVRAAGQWKCLELSRVAAVHLRAGDWHAGAGHSAAQTCVKIVDYDVNPDSPYNPTGRL